MTREYFLEFMETLFTEAVDILKLKNSDYANNQDPLSNFTLVEQIGVVDTEKAIFVRLSDKYARLANFLKTGEFKVKDEKLRDTVIDLINYAGILLYAIDRKTIFDDLPLKRTKVNLNENDQIRQQLIQRTNIEVIRQAIKAVEADPEYQELLRKWAGIGEDPTRKNSTPTGGDSYDIL